MVRCMFFKIVFVVYTIMVFEKNVISNNVVELKRDEDSDLKRDEDSEIKRNGGSDMQHDGGSDLNHDKKSGQNLDERNFKVEGDVVSNKTNETLMDGKMIIESINKIEFEIIKRYMELEDIEGDVTNKQKLEEDIIKNKTDIEDLISTKERLEKVFDERNNGKSEINDMHLRLFEMLGKLRHNPSFEEIEREFIKLLGSDGYNALKSDIKNVPYDDFMKAKAVFDKYRFVDFKTLNEEISLSAPHFLTLKYKIDKMLVEMTSAPKNSGDSHRYPCKPFNLTSTDNSSVIMINSDAAMTDILTQMNETKGCSLVLFYSPYCEFSARIAPLYNAVGRSYPLMPVIALDAQSTIGMSARYGIVGIPTIILFYSGKAMGKFNGSRTAQHMHYFVKDNTGFDPISIINITEEDFKGPLSSIVKESPDYFLIFSTVFLFLIVFWIICGSYIVEMCLAIYDRWNAATVHHQKVE
ncbi:uncharacterized protein LOC105843094 isoform X1 [Hydra vulgaris]|uniref:Thioredoxin domain-containing protein 15 n=1 Tax=Hydra vulgaris TaxID=6087 RepID=T2M7I8_HYDVU